MNDYNSSKLCDILNTSHTSNAIYNVGAMDDQRLRAIHAWTKPKWAIINPDSYREKKARQQEILQKYYMR